MRSLTEEKHNAALQTSPLSPPGGLTLALGIFLAFQFMDYVYPLYLFPNDIERTFWGTFFKAGVITFLVVYFVLIRHRVGPEIIGMGPANPRRVILFGLLGGGLIFLGVIVTGMLLGSLLEAEPQPQPVLRVIEGARGWGDYGLLLTAVSVFAPWGEELYFRGVLYPVLRSYVGVGGGIILSSLIFAGVHLDPMRLLPLAAGGAVLAWVYERTGSIFAPMVAHGLWNGVMAVIVFLGGSV